MARTVMGNVEPSTGGSPLPSFAPLPAHSALDRLDELSPVVDLHRDAFAAAFAAGGPECVEEALDLAGTHVRVRAAGRLMSRDLFRAFAHLRREEDRDVACALTLDAWDEEATGVSCPTSVLEAAGAKVWPLGEGDFLASASGRFVGYRSPGLCAWFDRRLRALTVWCASARSLSLLARGKPLQFLLNVWLSDRGLQVIHSGLVSRNGVGVLFPGTGGAGKTTSSLSCLKAGFSYLGDDYISLEAMADGSFVGHSMYNTTWLTPEHLVRFPELIPHAHDGLLSGADKHLILLADVFPDRMERAVPIRALALPRIVDAPRAAWRPASKAEALLKIVPSSLLHIVPRPGREGMDRLAALVGSADCFWLELGRDLSTIPEAVAGIVERVT